MLGCRSAQRLAHSLFQWKDKISMGAGSQIHITFRSKDDESSALESIQGIRGPVHSESYDGGTISARNIRRAQNVYSIPLDSLRSPDFVIEADQRFVELYMQFSLGRACAFATRVPSDHILDGFYTEPPSSERKEENTPQHEIDLNIEEIRAGGRPSIWVRENNSCPDAPRFFHTDGIAVLKAYRQLGIRDIPVMIVAASPPVGLKHSCFVIGHGGILRDPVARIEDFHPCEIKTIPALLEIHTPLQGVLAAAKSRLTDAIEALRKFHQESEQLEILHYHDSVFSTLVRAQEYVKAIELLSQEKLWSPVPNLQRSLYELSLTYYVDWIAPQQTYFGMSVAASLDSAGLRLLEEQLAKDFGKQRSAQRAKELAKRALKFIRWIEKVSNKASFAPIGLALHEKFYSALSSTAHQDFAQTAKHANRFRDPTFEHFGEQYQRSLADFLNIVIGTILSMAAGDIPIANLDS